MDKERMGLHRVLCRPCSETCNRFVFAFCIQCAWSRPQPPYVPIQPPAVNPLRAYSIEERFKHGYTRQFFGNSLLTLTWQFNVHTVYISGAYTVALIVHPPPYSTKFLPTVRVQ